jgi:3-oxoacyl-[acyl-carrier protein] reductase
MALNTRFAIITGASSGIGSAIAMQLSNEDIHLVLAGRNHIKLQELKAQLSSRNINADVIQSDLSSQEGINGFIQNVKRVYKTIDVLINVAGIWHDDSEAYAGRSYETFDQKVIIDTMNVGTLAPMLLVHALIPLMPKKSKIVNISGTFESGARGWLPYYVSKRAMEDFTIGLKEELEDKDIQVNCVSPSDVATDAYKKFFPEYIKDAVDPVLIAKQVDVLLTQILSQGKSLLLRKVKSLTKAFMHKQCSLSSSLVKKESNLLAIIKQCLQS